MAKWATSFSLSPSVSIASWGQDATIVANSLQPVSARFQSVGLDHSIDETSLTIHRIGAGAEETQWDVVRSVSCLAADTWYTGGGLYGSNELSLSVRSGTDDGQGFGVVANYWHAFGLRLPILDTSQALPISEILLILRRAESVDARHGVTLQDGRIGTLLTMREPDGSLHEIELDLDHSCLPSCWRRRDASGVLVREIRTRNPRLLRGLGLWLPMCVEVMEYRWLSRKSHVESDPLVTVFFCVTEAYHDGTAVPQEVVRQFLRSGTLIFDQVDPNDDVTMHEAYVFPAKEDELRECLANLSVGTRDRTNAIGLAVSAVASLIVLSFAVARGTKSGGVVRR